MNKIAISTVSFLCIIFLSSNLFGQFCDSITPTFTANLSSSPTATWTSPSSNRAGHCCGATNPDRCIEFVITLHPDALAINFQIASGAVPPGALYYQVGCGPITPVGQPICLNGAGPHVLTFCKPGGNINTFAITSYSAPAFGPDLTLNQGCSGALFADYYDESTVTWTSVAPGTTGQYNNNLSCTAGCELTNFTANGPVPPQIDYMVCGNDINGCLPDTICGILSVVNIPAPTVSIAQDSILLCPGETNVMVHATVNNHGNPYQINWSNGSTADSALLGFGTHTVSITDTAGCSTISDQVVIAAQTILATVDAGAIQTVCGSGALSLQGTMTNAKSPMWSGGTGNFNPLNTLSTTYYPTTQDLQAGSVWLYLTVQSLNNCPGARDSVQIIFAKFQGVASVTTSNVTCYGSSDGYATVLTANSNDGPFTYSLNGGATTTNNQFNNLAPGNYSVRVFNSKGCDTLINFTITQPPLLVLGLNDLLNVYCYGGNNGMISVSASGGTPSYTYQWSHNGGESFNTANGLTAGNYTVIVNDQNGCTAIFDTVLTQPQPMANNFTYTPIQCTGMSTTIQSNVTGGIAPYDYLWTGGTTFSAKNVLAGTYYLTVSDHNGCQLIDTISVTEPTPLTSTLTNDTVVCKGSTLLLQGSANGGTPGYTYSWSHNSDNTPTSNYTVNSNGVVSFTASDANGCAITKSTNITTYFVNQSDLKVFSTASDLCLNDSAVLSHTYANNTPISSLIWTDCFNCGFPRTVFPISDTTYTARMISICGDTLFANVFINVFEPPILELHPNDTSICPGETVQFYIGQNTNPNQWSYLWEFGNGETSQLPDPIYSYANEGWYTVNVTLTNSFGCQFSTNNTGNVRVFPAARADFSSLQYSKSIFDPIFSYTNHSTNANAYTWNFGDGQGSTAINPQHTYAGAGEYLVSLIAHNTFGCHDTTSRIYLVRPEFAVFVPNAFTPNGDGMNDVFNVESFGLSDKGYNLMIFDRWGEMIFQSTSIEHGWNGSNGKDGTTVSDGVYTWVIAYKDLSNQMHRKVGHVTVLK